ncbi:RDD family protein [Flavobacterium muglaense]|uniref:RDD family protein n=1 Tax=Flavobacterium muglaense TaxID=2764716 RepID=A0A923SGD4_9FLAO|nr:RDD family protein [Flavobacterium muglaense]MBC5838952.1 RDD family protein [Flavobacterium muglaense]MBC5845455.1 RDD family protein [Flavobacterium muglaense]
MATKTHLGRRILAGLIDYSIILTFFCVFIFSFGTQNSQGEYTVTGILALVPFFFWFGFIVLIEVFLGATVGNSIVGLQPKSLTRNNGQLTFSQVLKRHLMDPFDLFPFGLIGIITIKNTEKHQRLGDIWAKTIVTPLTEN